MAPVQQCHRIKHEVNLYERMKNKTHWSDLYKKIRHSLMRYYTKEFILKRKLGK